MEKIKFEELDSNGVENVIANYEKLFIIARGGVTTSYPFKDITSIELKFEEKSYQSFIIYGINKTEMLNIKGKNLVFLHDKMIDWWMKSLK